MQKKLTIKTIILLLSFFTIIISSCKKTDSDENKVPGCMNPEALNYNTSANEDDGSCVKPEQKKRTMVLNFSSLGCGNCGSYGNPTLTSAYTTFPNDVVPIKATIGDDLYCSIGILLLPDYGTVSTPYFAVGNTKAVYYTDVNSVIPSEIAGTPYAGLAGIFSVSGSTISVKTQVKFYSAATGEYYLAVYLMENGISAIQSGAGTSPIIHNKLLRGNAVGNYAHGEIIGSSSIASGTIINKTYTASVNSAWNSANIYAALVLWKKNGSSWEFVNAYQTKAN
jgi:hypothetical protein